MSRAEGCAGSSSRAVQRLRPCQHSRHQCTIEAHRRHEVEVQFIEPDGIVQDRETTDRSGRASEAIDQDVDAAPALFDRTDQLELETWVTLYAEYKPYPDLSIRFEAHNLLGRDLTFSRQLYDAPRDTGAIRYSEVRPLDYPSFFYARIRKTF